MQITPDMLFSLSQQAMDLQRPNIDRLNAIKVLISFLEDQDRKFYLYSIANQLNLTNPEEKICLYSIALQMEDTKVLPNIAEVLRFLPKELNSKWMEILSNLGEDLQKIALKNQNLGAYLIAIECLSYAAQDTTSLDKSLNEILVNDLRKIDFGLSPYLLGLLGKQLEKREHYHEALQCYEKGDMQLEATHLKAKLYLKVLEKIALEKKHDRVYQLIQKQLNQFPEKYGDLLLEMLNTENNEDLLQYIHPLFWQEKNFNLDQLPDHFEKIKNEIVCFYSAEFLKNPSDFFTVVAPVLYADADIVDDKFKNMLSHLKILQVEIFKKLLSPYMQDINILPDQLAFHLLDELNFLFKCYYYYDDPRTLLQKITQILENQILELKDSDIQNQYLKKIKYLKSINYKKLLFQLSKTANEKNQLNELHELWKNERDGKGWDFSKNEITLLAQITLKLQNSKNFTHQKTAEAIYSLVPKVLAENSNEIVFNSVEKVTQEITRHFLNLQSLASDQNFSWSKAKHSIEKFLISTKECIDRNYLLGICNLLIKLAEECQAKAATLSEGYYEIFSIDLREVVMEFSKRLDDRTLLTTQLLYLGELFLNGTANTPKNFAKALDFFKQGEALQNCEAIRYLGDIYYYGLGVSKDYVNALKFYQLAHEGGSEFATNRLALMYYKGRGAAQDYQKAIQLCEKASENGNLDALYNLGRMYFSERGNLDPNPKKSYELWQYASDKGHIKSTTRLALNHSECDVQLTQEQVIHLCELASVGKDSKAMEKLATIYSCKESPYFDYQKAIKYYRQLIKNGYKDAAAKFRFSFSNDLFNDVVSEDKYTAALYDLAEYYYDHKQDMKLIFNYIEKLANKEGYAKFKTLLGLMWQNNRIPYWVLGPDLEKAERYYLEAANLQDTRAMVALGLLYLHLSFTHKQKEAKKWLDKALDRGDLSAKHGLGCIYLKGIIGLQPNEVKARQLLEEVVNNPEIKDNKEMMLLHLAESYCTGKDIPNNYFKAIYLVETALAKMSTLSEEAKSIFENICNASLYSKDSLVLNKLALLNLNGQAPLQKNNAMAFSLLKVANSLGNFQEVYFLGMLFEQRKDFPKAILCYVNAFSMHNRNIEAELARLHEHINKINNEAKVPALTILLNHYLKKNELKLACQLSEKEKSIINQNPALHKIMQNLLSELEKKIQELEKKPRPTRGWFQRSAPDEFQEFKTLSASLKQWLLKDIPMANQVNVTVVL